MKRLVFKEVLILSKPEKKARRETFSPSVNLMTGENDVGKSTLIKVLYHTLGANVPQLQNTRWKRAKPIYCLRFSIGDAQYFIVRDDKYFGVFDAGKKMLGRYAGITTEGGIAHFINPLLNFRIELERSDDAKLGLAGPAYYFLPFYVDQDEGWTRSWASFVGLPQFKDYRKNMLDYHLGVRPQSYYDAKKRAVEWGEQLSALTSQKTTLEAVRDSYQKRKAARQLDIDPAIFRKEIEELVDKYNAVWGRQQQALQAWKDARGECHNIENEILILRRAIKELDADYDAAEDPETPDVVPCPTCGTEIANSIVERFGILDDIDYCYSLIDQRSKKLLDARADLKEADDKYRAVTAELSPIDDLLKRKRENVTFAEFVSAEGVKEVLASISDDIGGLQTQETDARKKLEGLAEDLKIDAKRRKKITEYYQARMKEFLDNLNVHVLETADYKSIDRQIKNNALGSDLPRSLLAQYLAFLHTMKEFNTFVVCPLVIDSPLQQEQDNSNVNAIFKFILSRALEGQQLIVGTVSLHGLSHETLPEHANTIHLTDKYGLLQADQYSDVFAEIGTMHEATLASD